MIPYHECTDEDWGKFAPTSQAYVDSMEAIKSNPTRGMFCIDWDKEDISIYGNEKNDFYTRIEVVLVPCNYIHTPLGYEEDEVHEDCVADKEEQIKYLGPIDFMIFYTEEIFY